MAKKFFIGLLMLIAVGLAILAPSAPVNVDEQLHYPHAKRVVNWYFTGGKDQSCLNTPQTNLKYYGQSIDNFTALVNRVFHIKKEFLLRHFTGAFFFWLLLLFSGLLAFNLTRSWWVAAFTVLSLIFMPRLAGQAFGNLKDIPFAAGYMAGLLMIFKFLKEFPAPKWKTSILLGLAIAFTVSVRAGGFILFAYLGLGLLVYIVLKPFYLKQIVKTKPVFVRLLGQGTVILIIGYFAGLLFWPYALQNILEHPLESLRVMEHYKVSIRQVFEGEMQWSTQLPWYYLAKWLVISSPVFILIGLLLFSCFFFRKIFVKTHLNKQMFFEGFIFFAFAFPFIYVMAIGSNLYSGVRQMLFILPPLALMGVCSVYKLLRFISYKNKTTAYAFSFFFFLLIAWPFKHQAATFPVDYVFFNALAGGNQNAWGNYEYDYYFHAVKEATDYVVELAADEEITVAMNCNLSNYFEHHPHIKYQYTRFLERSSYDWDYAVFGVNYIHPYLLKNNRWKPAETIKTFYHKGNPVAVLLKRTDKTAFLGISEIKSGNLKKGICLLETRIKKETNDVWLFAQLANAKLARKDVEGFRYCLEKGREIHPFFEPFLLLEATHLFDEERYRESLEKLNTLFEINPRYLPAKQMLEKVKEQIN